MNATRGKEIVKKLIIKAGHFKKPRPKALAKNAVKWSILSMISTLIIGYFFLNIFPRLPFHEGPVAKIQAYALASKKIIHKALLKKDATIPGKNAEEIVSAIVRERTKNNYLYTGGHYTDFYIRNLGTFANKLLAPQAAQTPEEWLERVKLVTRSTELALGVFNSYNEITTTIVQLDSGKYVPINIYVEPSDSLASLMKTIYQLQKIDQIPLPYPLSEQQKSQLSTIKQQGYAMESNYKKFLGEQAQQFIDKYTDSGGLVKPNVTLSGIKDSWIRSSSFYDNVMLWSIYHYSYELGLKPEWYTKADKIKQKLLSERWNSQVGIFYDELPSSACMPKISKTDSQQCLPYFSADNLISYEMGMLSPYNEEDRPYLKSMVEYIRRKKLDLPLPLKTTEVRIASKEHLPVRIFAPNYIGTTIWSYWGMIYIDLLDTLGDIESNTIYNSEAQAHFNSYTQKITEYKGFPELYSPNGNQYRLFFYRSVNDMVWGIYYLYLQNKVPTTATNS